jgi:long-chain fatty acid transport protein
MRSKLSSVGPLFASLATLVAAPLVVATNADAAGFATARFGAEHGHPTTENPTALYYNPAGLAEDTPGFSEKDWRVKIFVDGNVALRAASFTHAPSEYDEADPEGAPGANAGTADLFNVITAPAAFASFQLGDFALGAGFFVPFGGQSSWSQNDTFANNKQFAGPVDGVQRWHSIDGVIRSMYLSLGAAYDIADRVSVGASFNMVKSEIKTLRARIPDGSNDVVREGRSLIEVEGWHGAFGVGVTGEVVKNKVWVGASYQSQPGLGDMTLEGTLTNNFAGQETEFDVKLIQQLPDIYRLGIRARPTDDWELRLFGDFQNWKVFKNQCVLQSEFSDCPMNDDGSFAGDSAKAPLLNIVRNWGAAFGVRGGASYWVLPELETYLGAGFDSNAVPDSTLEPALTDFAKISAAAGARYSLDETLAIALTYAHIFYLDRDTTGKSELPTLEAPSKTPDSGGEYTQTIGVVNVNAQVSF